jgi:dihydroflavonol-4-reductase
MQVLVTGATGFIGSWLSRKLVELGHEVHILRRENSSIEDLKDLDLVHHIGDVTNRDSIDKAIKSIEVVFHLAGVVGYTKTARKTMNEVNVQGTENVAEACSKNGINRLVHFSSVSAIGAGFSKTDILNEDSHYNLEQYNLGYFETKRISEEIVKKKCHTKEIDAVILNPSTAWGAGDFTKGSRKTQLKVAKGSFPFYTAGGASIISIENLINATIQALEVGRSGERYILSGENITIEDLFKTVAQVAGVNPPGFYLPNLAVKALGFLGDSLEKLGTKGPINSENAKIATLYHWFDSTKAQKELNLSTTSAKEAIGNSVNWAKQRGLLK